MNIEQIELSWFRGAGATVTLSSLSKNVVVYGGNGSGKSCFVDAIEYIIGGERIEHLAHEYSGHKQLLGIRNTNTPNDSESRIEIRLDDKSTLKVAISPKGHVSYLENPSGVLKRIRNWDLMGTVLRQDKVADFIHATKGQKYSEVLPLLGLDEFEAAAENLRRLRTRVEEQANLAEAASTLAKSTETTKTILGTVDESEVVRILHHIGTTYQVPKHAPTNMEAELSKLQAAVMAQIEGLEPAHQRHFLLKQISDEDLEGKRQKALEARKSASGILDRKVQVLIDSEKYAQEIGLEEIECPACGRLIALLDLRKHISLDLDRLQTTRLSKDQANTIQGNYLDAIKRTVALIENQILQQWLTQADSDTRKILDELTHLELSNMDDWSSDTFAKIDLAIEKIVTLVNRSISATHPPIMRMLDDLKLIEAARSIAEIAKQSQFVQSLTQFSKALEMGEENVRDHLKSKVEAIVSECSSDVQKLWSVLHPDEPIEDIRLTMSEDKAIDIELKFYGKLQSSPRLTLSEGHRNSLSVCIFLALASLTEAGHNPIVLDDIVSSLDRDHRGRLTEILQDVLKERQILLFTHDRDWYAELKSRLSASQWTFLSLRPWQNPDAGIHFSRSPDSFDDAREIMTVRPESAGNTVRSIMDSHCAIAAEALQISLPFRRGEENDRRSCIDILDKICAEGRKRLRHDAEEPCDDIIQAWTQANDLLKGWANRSSHTGSLTSQEASQLIDTCEIAISKFSCESCKDPFWIALLKSRKIIQCSCGRLHWDIS